MSQHERAARLGAKTLFSNMAQGNEFVTTKQLEQWLEDTFASRTTSQLETEEALKQVTESSSLVLGGELISEQHMVLQILDILTFKLSINTKHANNFFFLVHF